MDRKKTQKLIFYFKHRLDEFKNHNNRKQTKDT